MKREERAFLEDALGRKSLMLDVESLESYLYVNGQCVEKVAPDFLVVAIAKHGYTPTQKAR